MSPVHQRVLRLRRRLPALATAISLVGLLVAFAPVARAEDIVKLTGPVTDTTGLLAGGRSEIESAIQTTRDRARSRGVGAVHPHDRRPDGRGLRERDGETELARRQRRPAAGGGRRPDRPDLGLGRPVLDHERRTGRDHLGDPGAGTPQGRLPGRGRRHGRGPRHRRDHRRDHRRAGHPRPLHPRRHRPAGPAARQAAMEASGSGPSSGSSSSEAAATWSGGV